MQPQPSKKYTAADFARYHSGRMPPAQMHALEKAALEDPFLADAMDGYAQTKAAVKEVAALKRKVHKRTQNMQVVHRNRRMFLSVAALLILLAGFGWLATKLANRNERDLAQQKKAAPPYTQPPETPSQNAGTDSQPAATTKAGKGKGVQTHAKKEPQHPTTAANGMLTETARVSTGLQDSQTFSTTHIAAAPLPDPGNALAARRIPESTVKGRVVNALQQAIPNATVYDTIHHISATTDTAGNFSMVAPDSNLTVAVMAPGYQIRQMALRAADSGTVVVLQPAPEPLHKSIQVTNAEPRNGWRSYQAYINQNLVLPAEGAALTGTKEVQLSFDVDGAGHATAITIEKPLCPSCDSVAVRVIREGATWKKTKKKGKATARILF